MATQVFLHDTAATTHRGTNSANLIGTAVGWLPKATGTTRGAGVVTKITNTVVGTNLGVEVTNGAGGTRLEWLTPPVDADVTISGTITGNIWALESANNANTAINFVVDKIAAATGTITQIVKSARVTELTTGNLAVNFTATPTSTAVNKGDRLRLRIFGDDAGTMGAGFTFTTAYAGTTAAASGDTYISFTETFGFQTTDPTTSTLYLTDTASDVATGDVDREAWTSRGAGVQNDVTNTTTGWTAPVQVTDTAGGTAVSWFTKPLTAFTLSGLVKVNRRVLASNAAANASIGVEIARIDTSITPGALITQGSSNSLSFIRGAVGANEMVAQGFTLAAGAAISSVVLSFSKTGTPADNAVLDIVSTLDGTSLARATVAGSAITTSEANVTFTFTTPAILAAGSYFLQVSRSGARDTSNYFEWWHQTGGSTYAGGSYWSRASGSWTESSALDFRFTINQTDTVVWGYANRDAAVTSGGAGEVATTETAYTVYVSGDDLAFTDGQRIRIRLYQDDCADVPTVTGHSLTSYYGGTSGGASGDTYLIVGATLTEFSSGTNNTVTHTAPNLAFAGGTALKAIRRSHTGANLQLVGGTHTAVKTVPGVNNTVTHVGPNLQLIGGTHLKSTGRKVAQVAPNFALAGGVHLKSTGRKVAHVGANLGFLGGTHLRTLNRRITHVGANLQLVGGTHTPLKAKVVAQVAPNLALAGGTHLKSLQRSLTAPNLAFAGGTHTALKAKVVTHAAANLALIGGTHLLRFDRRPALVAPNLQLAGGTHLKSTGRKMAQVAPNLQLAGGTHVALKAKVVTQTAPNLQLIGGTHLRTLNRRPQHTAPNLQFAAGNHAALTGEIVGHTAPNLALAGGTHLKALRRSHTAANLQLAAGTHATSAGRRSVHVAPNLALVGGTHAANKTTGSVNYTATQVAPNLSLAAGTHTASPGRKVAHVAPNLALAGGTHGRTLNRRPQHVAPNLAFAAGNQSPLTGEIVSLTAPNLAFAAGTARLASSRSHTAPNLQLAAGTHTARKTKTVVQVAPTITLQAGTHRLASRRSHTAPNLQLQGGTHTASRARFVVHTAAQFQIAAGVQARRVLKAHTAPNLQLAAGVHVASAFYLIDTRWTIELDARWQPIIEIGGRHAPTVANRGAHRPTVLGRGVYEPTLTKAGALTP